MNRRPGRQGFLRSPLLSFVVSCPWRGYPECKLAPASFRPAGNATEFVEIELDNLRAGFRWATDQADLVTAITIAGHTTNIASTQQQSEPVGWAEELLPAAIAAEVPELHSC